MLENFQKNVNSSIGMVTLRKGMSAFFLLCPFGAFGVMMAFMCPFSPEVGELSGSDVPSFPEYGSHQQKTQYVYEDGGQRLEESPCVNGWSQ